MLIQCLVQLKRSAPTSKILISPCENSLTSFDKVLAYHSFDARINLTLLLLQNILLSDITLFMAYHLSVIYTIGTFSRYDFASKLIIAHIDSPAFQFFVDII